MNRLPSAVLGVALLVACGPGGQSGGVMDITWVGADTAQIRAPATARWCQEGNWLEVTGLLGDTGVGVVVYPEDSIRAGAYPVHDPTDSLGSGAAIALRWFGANAVYAFQSRSGSVSVAEESDGTIRGHFDARAVSVMRPETLAVAGTFRHVSVIPGETGCAAVVRRPVADTSVD